MLVLFASLWSVRYLSFARRCYVRKIKTDQREGRKVQAKLGWAMGSAHAHHFPSLSFFFLLLGFRLPFSPVLQEEEEEERQPSLVLG